MAATSYKDRISETSTFTGGGVVPLLGPINGFAGFTRFNASQSGIPVMFETVDAASQPTGEWEVALCTLSADRRTLTRNTVRDSSNAGATVSFGAGTKRVTVVNDGMSIEGKASLAGGNVFTGNQTITGNVTMNGASPTINLTDAAGFPEIIFTANAGGVHKLSAGSVFAYHTNGAHSFQVAATPKLTVGAAAIAATVDITVPDEAYGAPWNGSLEVPTKNAVFDRVETVNTALGNYLPLAGGTLTGQLGLTNGTEVETIQGVDGWGLISNVPAGRTHRQRVAGVDIAVLSEPGLTITSATSNTLLDLWPPDALYSNIRMRGRYGNAALGLDILAGNQNAYFSADNFTFRSMASVNYATLDATGMIVNVGGVARLSVAADTVNMATNNNYVGRASGPVQDNYITMRNTNYYNHLDMWSYDTAGANWINDAMVRSYRGVGLDLIGTPNVRVHTNPGGLIANFNSAGFDVVVGTIKQAGSPMATVSQLANYLPLTGGTITGGLTIDGNLNVKGFTQWHGPQGVAVGDLVKNHYSTNYYIFDEYFISAGGASTKRARMIITSAGFNHDAGSHNFRSLAGTTVYLLADVNGLTASGGAHNFGPDISMPDADTIVNIRATNVYSYLRFYSAMTGPTMDLKGQILGSHGWFYWDAYAFKNLAGTDMATLGAAGLAVTTALPVLTLKDTDSVGNLSIGFVEFRDSANTRYGFVGKGNGTSADMLFNAEQAGGVVRLLTQNIERCAFSAAGLAVTGDITLGTTAAQATATPINISMGGTFSSTPGANPKLKLFNDGAQSYGLGVSNGSLDYMAPSGGTHNFYVAGVRGIQIQADGQMWAGIGNFQSPGSGSTGGVRILGHNATGYAYLQITDNPITAQWSALRWNAAGEMYHSGSFKAEGPIHTYNNKRVLHYDNPGYGSSAIFVSTAGPSGGADGDIWLQVL